MREMGRHAGKRAGRVTRLNSPFPTPHSLQYCANECACELPTSAATPSTTAEPRVKAFDGGSTDAIAGTVASNEAAGRSIAPPSVADVDRWDGCCATPVRRPSNSWEDVDEAAL